MKQIFKMMALLLCLTATAGMIGCSKDDSSSSGIENGGGNSGGGNSGGGGGNPSNPNAPTSISGTRWKYSWSNSVANMSGYQQLTFSSTKVTYYSYTEVEQPLDEPPTVHEQTLEYSYTYSNGSGTIGNKSFTVSNNTLNYNGDTYIKQ